MNFVTSFEFVEENNLIEMKVLANETSYNIDNNQDLISEQENKKTTYEYYDLIYQYKMDCLVAGIKP